MPSKIKSPRAQKRALKKPQGPLIRCVIFDLDDTLYDCFAQRVRPAHRHAAEAMVKAGIGGSVNAVYRARMRAFLQDPMLRYIDAEICRQFECEDPTAVSRLAHDAYFTCPVGELTLFAGTRPLLRFLQERGVRAFIVSFGEPHIQRAKVKALGLDNEPVDAILLADRGKVLTKDLAFEQILKKTRLPAEQILVVGDRPSSEIRAGKALGMRTVRIRRGEFVSQEPMGPEETPDYVVKSISEVRKLPFAFGKLTTDDTD